MKPRPLAILTAVTLLACGTVLWLTQEGLPPRVPTALHAEIGRTLAREAVARLRPGGKVTLLARDTATFPQPAMAIAVAAFLQELARAGVPAPDVQSLQVDPLRPVQVPSGDFAQFIQRAAKGDVVASLMGPPSLTEEQRVALGEVRPGIVAFCGGYPPDTALLRQLAGQHLLHAAVLSRPPASIPAVSRTRPTVEAFADLYVVAREPELSRLPAPGQP